MKIAALYVSETGPYIELPNVEAWGITKDARNYSGPYPVIAHPPCERWGRYWSGGPSVKVKRKLGDDGGCFERALASVREFGGVLEHPEASHAWKAYGLNKPPKSGGWIKADEFGGWTCCVEQGHYGHRARKATWLYSVGTIRPELIWGASSGVRIDEGFRSNAQRAEARARGVLPIPRLSFKERIETPPAFKELLLMLARSVNKNYTTD